MEPIPVAMPAPCVPKQNVVAYMAGYLIRQNPIDNPLTCSDLVKVDKLSETSPVSQYELLRSRPTRRHIILYTQVLPSQTLCKLWRHSSVPHLVV